jgi:arylsulfatase A-like enzyme
MRFGLTILLAPIVLILACGGGAETEAPKPKENVGQAVPTGTQHNVILVLADALRADRLGPHGYSGRNTSPAIDSLAEESTVFVNAIAQNAWTIPSVASLFTGVYPRSHRALKYQKGKNVEMDTLSMDHETLAEQFKAAGYATNALMKSTVIDSSKGFCQGFEACTVVEGKSAWDNSGEDLTDAATAWMDTQTGDKPYFLYLHYMDPHSPYIPPEPWHSKYTEGYKGELTGRHKDYVPFQQGKASATPEELQQLSGVYDGSVEYWDHQIGRLIADLKAKGRWENTLLVITGDHGEALGERGNYFHGNLFQENIHVPLIFKVPGVKAQRISQYVQMMDIGPTLTTLTGVKASTQWQGKDQAPAILKGENTSQVVYSEYAHTKMVIDPNGLKLILGEKESPLLFDLKVDPLESKNLAGERSGDLARLKAAVSRTFNQSMEAADQFSVAAPVAVDEAHVDEMKALGYIE